MRAFCLLLIESTVSGPMAKLKPERATGTQAVLMAIVKAIDEEDHVGAANAFAMTRVKKKKARK